ncbi:hypothetical protein LARI1_G007901 [Lachnellula arida]|uniref:Heterokaryon incompatibility domain-containing protein n=1 Tax=Lachnellula arida TaxID=1316785 RepID=A0A8T9B4M6_9HELO|nr:hypothetical protein LARI1_G007901 [Lachnellula arida]
MSATTDQQLEVVDFPGIMCTRPCERCKSFTVDYFAEEMPGVRRYHLPYQLEDSFPDVPKLTASADGGCGLCSELRRFVISKINGPESHSTSKVEAISHITLRAELDQKLYFPAFGMSFIFTFVSVSSHGKQDLFEDYRLYAPSATSPKFRSRRFLAPSTLSPENISLVQSWMKDCETNHVDCRGGDCDVNLPTRVIDVSTTIPLLIESAGKTGRYATLTYCWGISDDNPYTDQYMTNLETLDSRMRGMSPDEMPQTFQDAVTATKTLGLQYLWIDALCIIQDDQKDKEKEIPQMTSIYTNATITFSAIQAANSRSGFLARDPAPLPTVIMPYLSSDGKQSYYYLYAVRDAETSSQITTEWARDIDLSDWNKRAWTFQERLLSRRILHFTKRALYFECHTSDATEGGDKPRTSASMSADPFSIERDIGLLARLKDRGLGDQRRLFDTYYYLAIEYSRRSLSYQTDKEHAFSAVILRFKEMLLSQYAAGIWKSDLIEGLLWDKQGRTRNAGPITRHTNLPSWSWFPIVKGVCWPFRKSGSELQSFASDDCASSSLIPTKDALTTLYVPAVIVNVEDFTITPRPLNNHRSIEMKLQGRRFGYADLDDPSIEPPTSLTMCCIGKRPEYVEPEGLVIRGLLVEPVEGRNNCFRRIGIFESTGRVSYLLDLYDAEIVAEGEESSRKHYEFFAPVFFSLPVSIVTLV